MLKISYRREREKRGGVGRCLVGSRATLAVEPLLALQFKSQGNRRMRTGLSGGVGKENSRVSGGGEKIWRKSGRILLSKSWDFVGGGGGCVAASASLPGLPFPLPAPPIFFSLLLSPTPCDASVISSLSLRHSSPTPPSKPRERSERGLNTSTQTSKSFPSFLIPLNHFSLHSFFSRFCSLLILLTCSSSSSWAGRLPYLRVSTMALTAEAQFHVLAVDDSLIDRKLIERLLKTSSYQVTTVDSGSKALEFLGLQDEPSDSPALPPYHQEIEVNLVITDYCMPGMTGYELLKKIKETSSLKDIPVVIMSSENVPSRINRCLEEGAEEFFLKPVQLSDMEKLVPHIMKRRYTEQRKEGQVNQQQQASQPQQNSHYNLTTAITTDNSTNPSNSNKRKAMDESLSPERTRPRCTVSA